MRNFCFVGAGIVALAALCSCHSTASQPQMGLPQMPFRAAPSRFATSGCGISSAGSVTVCVRVPSGSPIATLHMVRSIDGQGPIIETITVSSCGTSEDERLCKFPAFTPIAEVVNDVVINAYELGHKAPSESGSFPVCVGCNDGTGSITTAVLGGSTAQISLIPFLIPPNLAQGQDSFLPVGQTEYLWVVAQDQQQDVIIGAYQPSITISTTGLTAALGNSACNGSCSLGSSSDAELLNVTWTDPLNVTATGSVEAQAGSLSEALSIEPSSGVIYEQAPPNQTGFGAGPVAIGPNGDVYFAINDLSPTGCRAPGSCTTQLAQFDPSTATAQFSSVTLSDVPGIDQLYFNQSDGSLWISTFAPVGTWNYGLPVFRMARGTLSMPQQLPASFGEASGFTNDGSGNLWISGCFPTNCKANHSGKPAVLESSGGGSPSAGPPIYLPMSCTQFGYFGYSVGDIGYSNDTLYVLGLNDGSPPPAHGALWQVPTASSKPACYRNGSGKGVPVDFNPSAYFASANGALVFGIGDNAYDFRWLPNHGFDTLASGTLTYDKTPLATANHLSAYGADVYYVHEYNLANNISPSGLGFYQPPPTKDWGVFPSATFAGAQAEDGVAAAPDGSGAWFATVGACSTPAKNWQGVCLGRARYVVDSTGTPRWSGIPHQTLPPIGVGKGTAFAVITSLDAGSLFSHGGPFDVKSDNDTICAVKTQGSESVLSFGVVGVGHAGEACPITITDKKTRLQEVLVTAVATPSRPPR